MLKSLKVILLLLTTIVIVPFGHTHDNPYEGIPMSRSEDGGFVLGNPDATVKIIEFADFLCPHCQDYKSTIDEFIEQYVITGQAQFEYRMFPIVSQNSIYLANLVECADIQSEGLFWQAHDAMYEIVSGSELTESPLEQFAGTLSLDESTLNTCISTATQHESDSNYARNLGITGTPTIAVQYGDNEPILFSLPNPEQLGSIVNAERPTSTEPVVIDSGRYAGIQTYRTEDGGIVLGDPDAPLTIVAFEDFMCPHCQNYQPTIHSFIENYVATGQAKFEYRFFPLVNPDYSMLTSQVAECVALEDISKFWDAHDLLFDFASSDEIDDEIGSVVAMLVGVDSDKVSDCLNTSIQPLIDIQLGRQAQVTGTPGIRARGVDGQLDIIYTGQQSLERGAVPLEILNALAEGSDEVSIGQPEISLLNDDFLDDNSLLTQEPCGSPCWQNITPGETSLEDARTIVEQLANANIVQDDASGFAFTMDSDIICCQIATQDGETVTTIFLQLAPNMLLGEVIENHDEPTYISGEQFSDSESIMIAFYPDMNALIYTVVDGENGQLSEESPVFTVIYTSTDLMNTIVNTNPLDNWKGYLSYDEYMDGQFDKLP